jgi:hypothetical protein
MWCYVVWLTGTHIFGGTCCHDLQGRKVALLLWRRLQCVYLNSWYVSTQLHDVIIIVPAMRTSTHTYLNMFFIRSCLVPTLWTCSHSAHSLMPVIKQCSQLLNMRHNSFTNCILFHSATCILHYAENKRKHDKLQAVQLLIWPYPLSFPVTIVNQFLNREDGSCAYMLSSKFTFFFTTSDVHYWSENIYCLTWSTGKDSSANTDSPLLTKSCISKLIKKWQTTGSVLDETWHHKKTVLTVLEDIRVWLQIIPWKALRRLSQEMGVSVGSASKTTKLLKFFPYRVRVMH